MTTRERVETLGRELLSYLPQAKSPSALLSQNATPGPAGSRRVPCTACQARGRMRSPGRPCVLCPPRRSPTRGAPPWNTAHGCVPCLACEGAGWRKRRAGEAVVDEYLGSDEKPWHEGQDLERRLARTERLLKLWLEPEAIGFGWEEQRETMWRAGSFAELDAALRRMREIYPGRFKLWWRVIVVDEQVTLSGAMREHLGATSDLLASDMPRPIRVPSWLRPAKVAQRRKTSLWRGQTNGHALQRAERNDEIVRQASALGWSSTKIAHHHGLTKQRVNQILAARKEEV